MLPEDDFPITVDDLQFIVGEEYETIRSLAIDNSFCHTCFKKKGYQMKIDKLYLLSNNDVVFKGNCTRCGGRMARVVEIGEQSKFRIKTDIVRNQKNNKN